MLFELGILNPEKEEDRIAALKAIDAKTADEIVNDNLLDERQEEKWLQRMIANPGFQVPMLGVENPYVRTKVLERFVKSDEFWEVDQAAQSAIMKRIQTFSQMIQDDQAAQLEMAQMMSGSQSKPAGTPSAPKRQRAGNVG